MKNKMNETQKQNYLYLIEGRHLAKHELNKSQADIDKFKHLLLQAKENNLTKKREYEDWVQQVILFEDSKEIKLDFLDKYSKDKKNLRFDIEPIAPSIWDRKRKPSIF